MPTYTLIMDYCGGTYISQVTAPSVKKAMMTGVQNLDTSGIVGLGTITKELLSKSLVEDGEPTRVKGVQNVWCSTPDARGKLAMLTLVQTDVGKS